MRESETVSEKTFRKYCEMRGYSVIRIQDPVSGRFPDFEVGTPCGVFIAEIKEVTPNESDLEFRRSLDETGRGDQMRRPGKRVGSAIRSAKGQLKRFKDRPIPKVIVLFDNRAVNGRRIDIYGEPLNEFDIDAGMFGEIAIQFTSEDEGDAANENSTVHAGNRALTGKRGQYVSALAVLFPELHANPLRLEVYHNFYASHPLYPGYIADPVDTHFLKRFRKWEVLPGWDEFVGERACCHQTEDETS